MPTPDPTEGLLSQLQATASRPLLRDPLAQFAGLLAAGPAAFAGEPNPIVQAAQEERDRSLRNQVGLLRVRQSLERTRMEKSRLLLEIARGLPDDDPIAVRKKMEIYTQSGLVTFSPQDLESAEGLARGKQRIAQLPHVLGGMRAGLTDQDLQAFFPGVGTVLNLPRLRTLTPDQRDSLGGPTMAKQFAEATSATLKATSEKIRGDALAAVENESNGRGQATPFQRALVDVGPKTPDDLAGRLAVERATNPGRRFTPAETALLTQFEVDQKVKGATGAPQLAMRCALGDQASCTALSKLNESDLNALKVRLSGEIARITQKEQRGDGLTDSEQRTKLQWEAVLQGTKGPKPLPSTLRSSLTQAKETVESIQTIQDILDRHPEFKKRFGVIRGNSALVTFRFLGLNNQELTDLISATKNLFLAGGKQQFGARFTQSEMRLLNLAKPSLDQPFETFLANLNTWNRTALPKYRALLKEARGLGADTEEYELTRRPTDPSLANPATRRALELLTPSR